MTFQEAIVTCFRKYAIFSGTASRSEYWWFVLFVFLAALAASAVHPALATVFYIATLLPSLAAATRRLHDTERSGWWQAVSLIPFFGIIVLIVFLAQKGRSDQ